MSSSLQLARRDENIIITDEQVALIKQTVAKDATNAELELFFYDCRRRGVHPLDKLIHFTKRGGKYTPITSIDYMRSQAAETGEYAGSDDPLFSGTAKAADFTATATVYRLVQGQRCAFTATARWSEYCPGNNQDHMWKKMPYTMLGKCAEGLALRKGFPQQLSGLYSPEEMAQSEPDSRTFEAEIVRDEPRQSGPRGDGTFAVQQPAKEAADWRCLPAQRAMIERQLSICGSVGLTAQNVQDYLVEEFSVESPTQLDNIQAAKFIAWLKDVK